MPCVREERIEVLIRRRPFKIEAVTVVASVDNLPKQLFEEGKTRDTQDVVQQSHVMRQAARQPFFITLSVFTWRMTSIAEAVLLGSSKSSQKRSGV
jgi:hypothetical protein